MKSSLKIVLRILGMSALMLVVGCASCPSSSTVQPWPDPPPDGYAILMMYDCNRKGGSGPSVFIDNTMIFKMRGNSYTWIYVSAGQHRFRTEWVWLMSGLNIDDKITFKAGESYYMKLLVSTDHNPFVMTIRSGLRQVSEQIAKNEAATCCYRKPPALRIDVSGEQPEKH